MEKWPELFRLSFFFGVDFRYSILWLELGISIGISIGINISLGIGFGVGSFVSFAYVIILRKVFVAGYSCEQQNESKIQKMLFHFLGLNFHSYFRKKL